MCIQKRALNSLRAGVRGILWEAWLATCVLIYASDSHGCALNAPTLWTPFLAFGSPSYLCLTYFWLSWWKSLCRPGWPLSHSDLPAFASPVLRLASVLELLKCCLAFPGVAFLVKVLVASWKEAALVDSKP